VKKRFIAGVMAGVLMLGGSAFAQTSEEILFRGIPWGQKLKGGLQSVIDSVGGRNIDSGLTEVNNDQKLYGSEHGYVIQGDYNCYRSFLVMKNFEVAGYPVNYIFIDSVPDVYGGRLLDTKEEAVVVSAQYIFDVDGMDDSRAALDDLVMKLSAVYGDPDLNDDGDGVAIYDWYGAGDSSAKLLGGKNRTDGTIEYISITYESCDLSDLFYNLNQVSEGNLPSSATDGL